MQDVYALSFFFIKNLNLKDKKLVFLHDVCLFYCLKKIVQTHSQRDRQELEVQVYHDYELIGYRVPLRRETPWVENLEE